MKTLEALVNIVLKEAPLSSYIKAGVRGAGKTIAALHDPHSSSKSQAFTGAIGKGLQKLGQPNQQKNKDEKNKPQQTQQTQQTQQQKMQQSPADITKAKTFININGQQYPIKYAGELRGKYPVYKINGIQWAKSIVLEPKQKNKLLVYMYKDKKPNLKKPPAVIKPGIQAYSGVQNKLMITTK